MLLHAVEHPPDLDGSRSSASALGSSYHILDAFLALEIPGLVFALFHPESLSDATIVLFVSIRHIVPGRLAIDRLFVSKALPLQSTRTALQQQE